MTPIQIGLIAGACLMMGLYIVLLRSALWGRLLALGLFSSAIAAIISPELTSRVAVQLGVGRGADLVLYLLIIGFWFSFIFLSSRIVRLEDKLTRLVRDLALNRPGVSLDKQEGPNDR